MLPDFLRTLKAKGFKVVHMVAGAGPTPVEKAGPDWKSTTEPIIAKTLGGRGRRANMETAGRRRGESPIHFRKTRGQSHDHHPEFSAKGAS